jgi:thiol-disulfide isomerase/thioredoxin
MDESIDRNRRRFLGRAAMTLAAAQFGILGAAKASEGQSRQLVALGRATEWLNSPPLSTTTLLGKVALVQFGTYTCINWLRTLPYVRAWVQKYRQGLIVIGVHTPEFAFEKNLENVRRAVQQMKIDYPIAIDNDYSIWRAFDNRYWPALYFVDARGRLRQHHFGEREYARSEMAIGGVRIHVRLMLRSLRVFPQDLLAGPAFGSTPPLRRRACCGSLWNIECNGALVDRLVVRVNQFNQYCVRTGRQPPQDERGATRVCPVPRRLVDGHMNVAYARRDAPRAPEPNTGAIRMFSAQ